MIALVADDAPVKRDEAVAALRKFGVTIGASVNDGAPAIEFLKKNPDVDLCILDVVMLGTTGLEVAKWVKDNGHKARCILVTSMGQDGIVHNKPEGVHAVLIKPYHPDMLIAKVVEVFDGLES